MTEKKWIYAALAAVLVCSVAFLGCPTGEEMVGDVMKPPTTPPVEEPPTPPVETTPTEEDTTEDEEDSTELPEELTGLPDETTEDETTEDETSEPSGDLPDSFDENPNPLPTN